MVTADDGQVTGRDPLSGERRWHYARERPLCTVGEAFSRVHAVYASESGCSEVTQLDPATGRRTAQRNGDAEHGTRLVGGDGHVTATGDRLLNTWRSDLVLTLEYGRVPAPVNPDRQPRPNCTYSTVDTHADRVAVIEDCPSDAGARLTVLKAAGEEADEPEEEFSTVLPQESATLLAVSENAVAVALPGTGQLVRYDHEGTRLGTHRLSVPADELDRRRPGLVVPGSEGTENRYVFTGSHTLALDPDTLTPRWTAEGTLGPGTTFANSYVVPIPRGLAVLDERDGRTLRTIAVDRRHRDAPVRLASAGPVLLEQRGETLVALR
uniref:Rv3212 family protein n=1 Tax=Saccharomonospora saliphila TaxID=369829 RepID=UPI001E2C7638|nr:PQQ-binding-like beta-propeller repeat protein [Saccharomonospora saliphila]